MDERSLLPATLSRTFALGRRALHPHSLLNTHGCSLLQVMCVCVCVCVCAQPPSRVPLLVNPCTIARQLPLSMEFSRQEYWSGLPFPTPRDLPDPRVKPTSPVLAGGIFTTESPGSPVNNTLSKNHPDLFQKLQVLLQKH